MQMCPVDDGHVSLHSLSSRCGRCGGGGGRAKRQKGEKEMFHPGFEPGTFCVLSRCDNHYTNGTLTWHDWCQRECHSSLHSTTGTAIVPCQESRRPTRPDTQVNSNIMTGTLTKAHFLYFNLTSETDETLTVHPTQLLSPRNLLPPC